jgi:hypothetical protein
MSKPLILMSLLALAGTPAAAVQADTLLIEGIQREAHDARPPRGMTMEQVSAGWGQPASTAGPVGQPPITRWEYADFIVFFEHRHVIHALARRTPAG